eukprot:12282921-Alexandrium_andersonii.AAC.1
MCIRDRWAKIPVRSNSGSREAGAPSRCPPQNLRVAPQSCPRTGAVLWAKMPVRSNSGSREAGAPSRSLRALSPVVRRLMGGGSGQAP